MTSSTSDSILTAVAIRVANTAAMKAFYGRALGFDFAPVETGPFTSWFGVRGPLTLKLVPIRQDTDFEGFAVHQLQFHVDDVQSVIDIAIQEGGAVFQDIERLGIETVAAVRDPDGNTLEIRSRA